MTASTRALRIHRHPLSGHCHRVELFAAILGLPVELVDVDLAAGAHKAPEFLKKSPFGQIPVLEDGDVVIADSTAILVYLAKKYDEKGTWLPADPVGAALVTQWLSAASGPLAYGPAAARVSAIFGRPIDRERVEATAAELLRVLDERLATRPFLVGASPTIADLAMYAYTAHAPEGGVSLSPYANVRAWIERVEALPRFVPMAKTRTAIHA